MTDTDKTRLEVLHEIHTMLMEKGNTFMAANVMKEIQNEIDNPTVNEDKT